MRPERRHIRARLASTTSQLNRRPDDPTLRSEVDRLRADYVTEALADHIAAVVAKAPPLTDAQLARLRSLLDVGGAA